MAIDEGKLKELLKSAVIEALEERRDLIKGIVEEAIEDLALASAIERGLNTDPASRDEVFALLENTQ